MPDIKALVASWRSTLSQTLVGREEALDELESHLWEEIERRTQAGADAESAFHATVAKLGSPDLLALEFAKVPAAPIPWTPVRVVCGVTILTTVGVDSTRVTATSLRDHSSSLSPQFWSDVLMPDYLHGVLLPTAKKDPIASILKATGLPVGRCQCDWRPCC